MIFVPQSAPKLLRPKMGGTDMLSFEYAGNWRVLGALVVGGEERKWFQARPSQGFPLTVVPVFSCPLCGHQSTNLYDVLEGACRPCRGFSHES
jgi:hypothetical protein